MNKSHSWIGLLVFFLILFRNVHSFWKDRDDHSNIACRSFTRSHKSIATSCSLNTTDTANHSLYPSRDDIIVTRPSSPQSTRSSFSQDYFTSERPIQSQTTISSSEISLVIDDKEDESQTSNLSMEDISHVNIHFNQANPNLPRRNYISSMSLECITFTIASIDIILGLLLTASMNNLVFFICWLSVIACTFVGFKAFYRSGVKEKCVEEDLILYTKNQHGYDLFGYASQDSLKQKSG